MLCCLVLHILKHEVLCNVKGEKWMFLNSIYIYRLCMQRVVMIDYTRSEI